MTPTVPPAAMIAPDRPGLTPRSTISGPSSRPMVAAVAALEPEIAANRPQENIAVAAVAPCMKPTQERENAISLRLMPPSVRKSPVMTNRGTARKMKFLIESFAAMPTLVSGNSTTK